MPKMRTTTGATRTGLLGRLAKISRKDMAFMASAAGLVVALPIATHFMMTPAENNTLKPGFSTRDSVAGSGEVFEPGVGGFAPGSGSGSSGEIITPLTARDPASLILGPDGNQPAAQPVTTPPPDNSFRDTIANSAGAGMRGAVSNASPMPLQRLQGALRGLGAVGGERSASGGTLPGYNILSTAKSAPSSSANKQMVSPVPVKGYAGAASRPRGGSSAAYDSLRTKSAGAADAMSGQGAIQALDKAASESVLAGAGSSDAGSGSKGAEYKAPGQSQKGSGSYSPGRESLEETLRRQRATHELDKKLANEDFYKYELPQSIMKGLVENIVGKGISEPLGKMVAGMWGGKEAKKQVCVCRKQPTNDALIGDCTKDGRGEGTTLKGPSNDEEVIKDWEKNASTWGCNIEDVGAKPSTGTAGGQTPATPPAGGGSGSGVLSGAAPIAVGDNLKKVEDVLKQYGINYEQAKNKVEECKKIADNLRASAELLPEKSPCTDALAYIGVKDGTGALGNLAEVVNQYREVANQATTKDDNYPVKPSDYSEKLAKLNSQIKEFYGRNEAFRPAYEKGDRAVKTSCDNFTVECGVYTTLVAKGLHPKDVVLAIDNEQAGLDRFGKVLDLENRRATQHAADKDMVLRALNDANIRLANIKGFLPRSVTAQPAGQTVELLDKALSGLGDPKEQGAGAKSNAQSSKLATVPTDLKCAVSDAQNAAVYTMLTAIYGTSKEASDEKASWSSTYQPYRLIDHSAASDAPPESYADGRKMSIEVLYAARAGISGEKTLLLSYLDTRATANLKIVETQLEQQRRSINTDTMRAFLGESGGAVTPAPTPTPSPDNGHSNADSEQMKKDLADIRAQQQVLSNQLTALEKQLQNAPASQKPLINIQITNIKQQLEQTKQTSYSLFSKQQSSQK